VKDCVSEIGFAQDGGPVAGARPLERPRHAGEGHGRLSANLHQAKLTPDEQ
jgi:hypothetical protein